MIVDYNLCRDQFVYLSSSNPDIFASAAPTLSLEFRAKKKITQNIGIAEFRREVGTQHNLQLYLIIRLHSEWERFVRDTILHSASGHTVTHNGAKITNKKGFSSVEQALQFLKTKNGQEPKWYNPKESAKLAGNCNMSNSSTIATVLQRSDVITAADYLRLIRNYIAHRNNDTGAKFTNDVVKALGLPRTYDITSVLDHTSPANPTPNLTYWTKILLRGAWEMIQ